MDNVGILEQRVSGLRAQLDTLRADERLGLRPREKKITPQSWTWRRNLKPPKKP